jgi:hypothetical protein
MILPDLKRPVAIALAIASAACALQAQDAKPEPLKFAFDDLTAGELPSELMVVDGAFEIQAEGAGKQLVMKPEPLTDGTVLLGKSMKFGGTVAAKLKASSVKRRHPKFGVSLGGTGGFRLRIAASEKLLEIAKGDERKATVEAANWKSGEWCHLELSAAPQADGKWLLEGRFWSEKETRPEKATISYTSEEPLPSGKAGLMGAPYSGTEIAFDDVTLTPLAEKKP